MHLLDKLFIRRPHLEFLVAMSVRLHGLQHDGGKLQLLLLQRRPELRRQDDGRQGQRRLLLLFQPRFFLTDVAVNPARVCHVLRVDTETFNTMHALSNADIILSAVSEYLQHDLTVMHVRLAEPQLQQLHVTNLPETTDPRGTPHPTVRELNFQF